MRELDDITAAIIDAAIQIHRDLGPGLLESVYEAVLAHLLEKRGFHVQRQTTIRFEYDGLVFEEGFRTDLIVDYQVLVELKSIEKVCPCSRQKAPDLPAAHGQARRPAPQLRREHPGRWPAPHRQRSPSLRVAAPPREPIGDESVAGRLTEERG
jgi:GxxExxY protein